MKQIRNDGFLKPCLADVEEYGEAVWFSSDITEAAEFGSVVLAVPHKILMLFRHKRISEYPRGWRTRFKDLPPPGYDMLVFEQVPIKYLSMVPKHLVAEQGN
jgi:hypothetical protein